MEPIGWLHTGGRLKEVDSPELLERVPTIPDYVMTSHNTAIVECSKVTHLKCLKTMNMCLCSRLAAVRVTSHNSHRCVLESYAPQMFEDNEYVLV